LLVLSQARSDGKSSDGPCAKSEESAQAEQQVCTRLHASTTSLQAVEMEERLSCYALRWIWDARGACSSPLRRPNVSVLRLEEDKSRVKALQLSQQSKRTASQAAPPRNKQKCRTVGVQSGGTAHEPPAPSPEYNTRGRKITLSSKIHVAKICHIDL
jgi:hypothetical protein